MLHAWPSIFCHMRRVHMRCELRACNRTSVSHCHPAYGKAEPITHTCCLLVRPHNRHCYRTWTMKPHALLPHITTDPATQPGKMQHPQRPMRSPVHQQQRQRQQRRQGRQRAQAGPSSRACWVALAAAATPAAAAAAAAATATRRVLHRQQPQPHHHHHHQQQQQRQHQLMAVGRLSSRPFGRSWGV